MLDDRLEALINATAEPGSRNRLSSRQVRDWLSDYLQMVRDDLARFPQIRDKPHADVLIADFDRACRAFFIVAVFSGQSAAFAAGLGDPSAVRAFVDRELPSDADRLIVELERRFAVAKQRLVVTQEEIEGWLP